MKLSSQSYICTASLLCMGKSRRDSDQKSTWRLQLCFWVGFFHFGIGYNVKTPLNVARSEIEEQQRADTIIWHVQLKRLLHAGHWRLRHFSCCVRMQRNSPSTNLWCKPYCRALPPALAMPPYQSTCPITWSSLSSSGACLHLLYVIHSQLSSINAPIGTEVAIGRKLRSRSGVQVWQEVSFAAVLEHTGACQGEGGECARSKGVFRILQ